MDYQLGCCGKLFRVQARYAALNAKGTGSLSLVSQAVNQQGL